MTTQRYLVHSVTAVLEGRATTKQRKAVETLRDGLMAAVAAQDREIKSMTAEERRAVALNAASERLASFDAS